MSQANTPAAGGQKPEYTKAFFSNDNKISLMVDPKNPGLEPGRPAFFGEIDGKKVNVFVEAGGEKDGKPYGAFLSINQKGAANGDGTFQKDVKMGKANVVVTGEGYARLAIKIGDQTLWGTPRKEMTEDLLAKIGLDVDKLKAVRAANASKAASNEPAKNAPKAA